MENKLLTAVLEGDEATVEEMVANGPYYEALHYVAAKGNERGIELLIRSGANVDVQDEDGGYTPLHRAVVEPGHANAVQKLMELGANVHAQSSADKCTPLHLLASYGSGPSSCAILRALLKNRGASHGLLIDDNDGDKPLHCAAFNGDADILKELMKAYDDHSISATPSFPSDDDPHLEAYIDFRNTEGRTSLHYATGKGNIAAVQLLMDAGASKRARDTYGATPFHFAARCGDTELLKTLKEDVNDPASASQRTALHFAAWNGRSEAVQWLLQNGAAVDVTDAGGNTPLHWAARNGNPQIIRSLIEQGGADVQLPNKKGELALGLADEYQRQDAAKAFVAAIRTSGQDIRMKDSLWTEHSTNGATLLHYFAGYGTEEDLKWIFELIQSKTAFNVVSKLDGKAVNKRDKTGRNAVHWAAMKGNKDAVRILAQNNADLNYRSQDGESTPLWLALLNRDIKFVETLFECRPKLALNAEDWLDGMRKWMCDNYFNEENQLDKELLRSLEDGFSKHKAMSCEELFSEIPPIYLALHAGREDIAKFIQMHSKGLDDAVNKRGERTGRTALHWATLLQQRKIVAQLCRIDEFSHELTANMEDESGKTALQYAKEMGLEDIEKELMQRDDVREYIDSMYNDRQVYVDAANAILVGAALIASVTFAGWLQPPLSYTPYYNLPEPAPPASAPPDIFQNYAAVQQHLGVRLFWVFNSLSFSFAIATVLAGLVAVVPIPGVYIATSVAHLRRCLPLAAMLLGVSIVFVLAAFAAAGFAVLPPLFEYQANMMATVIVGGTPCLALLAWFACRLWLLRPKWFRAFIKATVTSLLMKLRQSDPVEPSKPSATTTPAIKAHQNDFVVYGPRYDTHPWDDGLDNKTPPSPPSPSPTTNYS